MAAELVVDASVAVKWFITEDGSDTARAMAASGSIFIAPDLILAELASVASKRVRRGDIPAALGELTMTDGPGMFDRLVPIAPLVGQAFAIASTTNISVYDGLYLALAKQRGAPLVTADSRLVARAGAAGLGNLIREM